MKKLLVFDMDGTIADLYGREGWLEALRNEDERIYLGCNPMWNMDMLAYALEELQKIGYEVAIITWLSKDSTEDFKDRTREAKLEWLRNMGMPFDYFHGVQYGTTKANTIRKYLDNYETAILFDDNEKVRNGWTCGEAINPEEVDIVEYLLALLD